MGPEDLPHFENLFLVGPLFWGEAHEEKARG
jgi:hypothetical protein